MCVHQCTPVLEMSSPLSSEHRLYRKALLLQWQAGRDKEQCCLANRRFKRPHARGRLAQEIVHLFDSSLEECIVTACIFLGDY